MQEKCNTTQFMQFSPDVRAIARILRDVTSIDVQFKLLSFKQPLNSDVQIEKFTLYFENKTKLTLLGEYFWRHKFAIPAALRAPDGAFLSDNPFNSQTCEELLHHLRSIYELFYTKTKGTDDRRVASATIDINTQSVDLRYCEKLPENIIEWLLELIMPRLNARESIWKGRIFQLINSSLENPRITVSYTRHGTHFIPVYKRTSSQSFLNMKFQDWLKEISVISSPDSGGHRQYFDELIDITCDELETILVLAIESVKRNDLALKDQLLASLKLPPDAEPYFYITALKSSQNFGDCFKLVYKHWLTLYRDKLLSQILPSSIATH